MSYVKPVVCLPLEKSSIFVFCLLFFSSQSFAFNGDTLLPQYTFTEYISSFVIGLTLPVLFISFLLKPLLIMRWHYPALLTFILLMKFYLIASITQWQMPLLMAFSGAFILTACLWLQSESEQHSLKKPLHWMSFIVFAGFIIAMLSLPMTDVNKLWLVYSTALVGLTITASLKADKSKISKLNFLSLVIASYSVTAYLWLTASISFVWFALVSAVTLSLITLGGCLSLIQSIKTKVNNSDKADGAVNEIAEKSIPFDPVTNLPTYQQSLSRLKQTFQQGSQNALVAIVFKPINFDQVNKVLGHQNSDILLLQLAYNLQKCVDDNPMLANFNHHEKPIRISRCQGLDFLIVLDASLSNHPTKIIIEDLCQQLVKAVPQAMSFKSFSLNFELSFGVAISEQGKSDLEKLIAQASDALLEAERRLETLSYYDPQSVLYTERQLAKMEKLKQDIINEDITWLAHPQLSLENRTFKGFELAIEWQANEGNRLNQLEFDEIAEYSGEIYRLTKQMVKQAFNVLSTMHSKGVKENVAINLSSKDLLEPELADYIENQANRVNISLEFLVIELNEKVLLQSAYRARMMVDQLKALGIKIAIDHFSGSYESLRYLRRTSVQQVKIDCGLLNNEQGVKSEKTIVNALINLIRKMNIPIIATGINNSEIEKSYLAIGGDVAQGNLIHQGMKVDEVDAWLTEWQLKKQKA